MGKDKLPERTGRGGLGDFFWEVGKAAVPVAIGGAISVLVDNKKTQNKKDLDDHQTRNKLQLQRESDKSAVDKKRALADIDVDKAERLELLRRSGKDWDLEYEARKQERLGGGGKSAAEEEEPLDEWMVPLEDVDELTLDDIEEDAEEVPCLMGEWLHEGDMATWYAPTGVGKSILSMQIGLDLATGSPTEVWPVDDAPRGVQCVLYFDTELTKREISARYGKRIAQARGVYREENEEDCPFYIIPCYGTRISVRRFLNLVAERTRKCAEDYRHITIIIDNLDYFIRAYGDKASVDLQDSLLAFQRRAEVEGVTITCIFIGHTRKRQGKSKETDDSFGSSHKSNAARTMISVESCEDDKDCRIINVVKNRNGRKARIRAQVVFEKGNYHYEFVCMEDEDCKQADAQPDSASPAVGGADTCAFPAVGPAVRTEAQPGQSSVNYSSFPRHERLTWGDGALKVIHLAEKTAIWEIVREERAKGVTGREVLDRIEAFFNVTLNLTNVSQITKDGGSNSVKRPIPLNDSGDSAFDGQNKEVEKIKKLYFVKYQ